MKNKNSIDKYPLFAVQFDDQTEETHLWIVAPTIEAAITKAREFRKRKYGDAARTITSIQARGSIDVLPTVRTPYWNSRQQ